MAKHYSNKSKRKSMAMPKDSAKANGGDETQLYHKGKAYYGRGYGEFANLPTDMNMGPYPDPYSNLVETNYPDTLEEIDRDFHDNMKNVERQRSDTMY